MQNDISDYGLTLQVDPFNLTSNQINSLNVIGWDTTENR